MRIEERIERFFDDCSLVVSRYLGVCASMVKTRLARTRDPKRHALRGERGGGLGMRILI